MRPPPGPLLAILAPAIPACTTTVGPPANPADPVEVLLVDHGYHAALVLPGGDGPREYAFGEWRWFALNQDHWYRAPLLIFPLDAGVGRSITALDPAAIADLDSTTIRVERARADALRTRLDALFDGGEQQDNPLVGLRFCPCPDRYALWDNCNTRVADWLRELGCRVSGPTLFAEFEVRALPERPSAPAPAPMLGP